MLLTADLAGDQLSGVGVGLVGVGDLVEGHEVLGHSLRPGPHAWRSFWWYRLDRPAMALGCVGAEFTVLGPPAMREHLRDWGRRFTRAVTGDADGETRWSAARPEP